ncbi:hypothetical protein ASZ90_010869 [hydrocarbon metagenome]|uniref:Uncharacterized protein n=1 Tax=hydrocarbon metagenome TaxID=938273 RepID=A0A0W8FET9_9ZZZZ|nr:hypothetical protein [Methanomicrobiaceae archaeon]
MLRAIPEEKCFGALGLFFQARSIARKARFLREPMGMEEEHG